MKKTKVYDLPTRLFHWLFAGLFLGAFFIAKVIDDDSPSYSYHMLLGLVLVGVVGLRMVWGLVGSRYARFSSFPLKPNEFFQYFRDFVSGKTTRTLGHNPASSWAASIMMALALGLGLTGYLMTSGGNKEAFEDLHELLANTFIVVAIVHVTGVILHSIRHKDWIGLSMLSGKKKAIEGQAGIDRSHRGVALLFMVLVGSFVFHLTKNYDAGTQQLHFFGNTLTLGEFKNQDDSNSEKQHSREESHDDDKSEEDD